MEHNLFPLEFQLPVFQIGVCSNSSQIGFWSPALPSPVMSTQFAVNTGGEIFYGLGPIHMNPGQWTTPG